jgi:hypothetical protein
VSSCCCCACLTLARGLKWIVHFVVGHVCVLTGGQDAEQQYLLVRLAEEKDNIRGLVRNVLITWRGRDIPHLLKGKFHEHKVSTLCLRHCCVRLAHCRVRI